MTLVTGVLVPVALAIACVFQPYVAIALALYLLVFTVSTTAQCIGRAGLVPCATRPVVLGGGWSWVLGRKRCPANTIMCASGPSDRGDGWWHAGSTIQQVQQHLSTYGRTLAGHPSILSATLGGWIATKSHGTGGSLWTPTMGRVVADDPARGRVVLSSKKHVTADMVVREVELRSVPNVSCERRIGYLHNVHDARSFVDTPTLLRAVFVDKFSCLAVAWTPCDGPARSSVECPPLWLMTLLPARLRRGLHVERWTRRMSLRTANNFGPDPPFFLVAAMLAHTNFEVFVDEPSTPHLIWALCREFRALFQTGAVRGRFELRFGKTKQFLDFSLVGPCPKTSVVFAAIRRVYGTNVVMHLHAGKAQVPM